MYEAVHAYPEGESTVARLAATAADLGYDGIVVRNHVDVAPEYDEDALERSYGVDVVRGVEVRAPDPSRASGHLGTLRPKTTVLALHGGTNALNQFGASQDRVDVLAHPMRGEGDVNHVLVRTAADHGVRLEVDLAPVLRERGGSRVRAVAGLRKLRELVDAYDAPYVVSADPASHLTMRAPRELIAVGEVVGFDAEAIEAGLAEWGRIAAANRARMAPAFVEPGVWRGRYDDAEAGKREDADESGAAPSDGTGADR